MIDTEMIDLLDTLIKNHNAVYEKITCDIAETNMQTFQTLSK
jgi:hypothetical protein